jgi:hypothetical protein
METAGDNEQVISALLGTSSVPLPHILIYRGKEGIVNNFRCTPKNVDVLIDAIEELAESVDDRKGCNNEFNWQATNEHGSLKGDDSFGAFPKSSTKVVSSSGRSLGPTQLYLSTLNTTR